MFECWTKQDKTGQKVRIFEEVFFQENAVQLDKTKGENFRGSPLFARESFLTGQIGQNVRIFKEAWKKRVVAFSSHAMIWGECSTIHSPPALFFFFFFKVEISSRTLISLFRPGSVHGGSES